MEPFPCGKGLIEETYESNDWGQTSYHRKMLCQECLEKENAEKALKEERHRIAIKKQKKQSLILKISTLMILKRGFKIQKIKRKYGQLLVILE